jgi:transketolase
MMKKISAHLTSSNIVEAPNKRVVKKITTSYIKNLDISKTGTIRSGFGEGIVQATKKNSEIRVLSADLTDSLKLTDFKNIYSKKFFQMGICEQNMMSAAAGMSIIGKIPFVCSYAVFSPGRNWDQLRVSVCYSNHNVKIIGGHAGLTTGPDGATHQALEDIAITRVLPRLKVVVPCDQEEARKATLTISEDPSPCYLRLTREKSLVITNKKTPFEIGVANVLDQGSDVAIFACGIMVQIALEAREELRNLGISAAVINMHTIKPLDRKTLIKYAKKCGAIVSCEEHQKIGGLGSAISEILSQEFPVPQEFVGMNDEFGQSGDGYELLDEYGLSKSGIIKAVHNAVKRKKK